jgi:hypothetical protein
LKHPSTAEHRDVGQRGGSMISFYREHNGDYLAIDTGTNAYYLANFGKDHFEGRATAIEGQVGSVCTTGISSGYLHANCKCVAKAKVPRQWRKAIGI